MISMKQAVASAVDFAKALYAEEHLTDLQVEEIESSEDDKLWFITLGWGAPPGSEPGLFGGLSSAVMRRVYKVFSIDAETGEVISMKIRE